MSETDPQYMADEIAALMKERLGLSRGESLGVKIILSRSLLPRHIRKAAAVVDKAAQQATHPKLAKQIDMIEVRAAHRVVVDHLRKVDPKERRRGMVLGAAASLAINMLFLIVGMLLLLPLLPI